MHDLLAKAAKAREAGNHKAEVAYAFSASSRYRSVQLHQARLDALRASMGGVIYDESGSVTGQAVPR